MELLNRGLKLEVLQRFWHSWWRIEVRKLTFEPSSYKLSSWRTFLMIYRCVEDNYSQWCSQLNKRSLECKISWKTLALAYWESKQVATDFATSVPTRKVQNLIDLEYNVNSLWSLTIRAIIFASPVPMHNQVPWFHTPAIQFDFIKLNLTVVILKM